MSSGGPFMTRRCLAILSCALALSFRAAGQTQTASEGEHRVQRYLNHGAFNWNCQRTDHFQLCFDSQLQDHTDWKASERNAEKARKHVLRLAGVSRYRPTIHVFFLASRARMKELIGFDGEGRSRPTEHAVFSVVGPYDDLTHEMSHEILSNLWGAAEHWIEEGYATWAYKGTFAAMECRRMLDNGALLPLADLVKPEWEPSQYSSNVTYPELAGFVSYLREKYGLDRIKAIWRGGAASVPTVLGRPLPGAGRRLASGVARGGAEKARRQAGDYRAVELREPSCGSPIRQPIPRCPVPLPAPLPGLRAPAGRPA